MTVSKTVKKITQEGSPAVLYSAVTHVVYFLCGVMASRGALLGELAPFGASLTAAAPRQNLFSAAAGATLGYIILSPVDSFRYIASVAAICAIRWILGDLKRFSRSALFAPLTAFLPVLATGVALLYSDSSQISRFSLCVIEALAAGSCAFFIKSAVTLFSSGRAINSFSEQELACIAMAGCILVLSLGSVEFEQISLGRIIAVVVILLCGRYGSVTAGSISGIATGIVFSLSSSKLVFLSAGYSFGGMMCGLFAPVGKLGCAAVFFVCNTVMSLSSSDSSIVVAVLIETAVGVTAFLLIPKSVGNTLSALFLPSNRENSDSSIKSTVVMRLDFASNALKNVSECVTSVSDRLKNMYSNTIDTVFEKSVKEVCCACGLRVYCLEKQKEITKDDFNRLTKILRQNGNITAEDINGQFVKRCCKHKELAHSISKNYEQLLAYQQANQRVTQVRSVVAGQFSGLSELLCDLSQELNTVETYDTDCEGRVTNALRKIGLAPVDCVCRIDSKGRMTVEVEALFTLKNGIKKGQLIKEVSKACGRRFDTPLTSHAGDKIRLAFCELPVYDVEIGSSQHISENGNLCGDCINYFNNGFGSMIALISDGMGTGGVAAVDSNMTSSIMTKLCKAGLSYDCSLQVVNSALMVKSEEESLATLDMADINLFTGTVQLMKAGAPVTFIRKNGTVLRKNIPSLPIGILNEVRLSRESVDLSEGDMIVMVSDGALYGDEGWICDLILSWNEGSAEELAYEIVSRAQKSRNDGHDDDITAIAMRIVCNY